MRVKIGEGELGIKNMYAYYKSTTPNPLSYKQYKRVNQAYIKEITQLILEGENYKIPYKLGYFRIRKTKTDLSKLAMDFKTSRELGIRVYHLNDHSDGFRVKYLWEKKRAILKTDTKRPYSFTLCRDLKRRLSSIVKVKDGHSRYAEEILNEKIIQG